MKLHLKYATPGPHGSKASIAAGHAETAQPQNSQSASAMARVCYVSSGLALATFSSNASTSSIVCAAPGPIKILKCSKRGDTLGTVHQYSRGFEVLIWKQPFGRPTTRFTIEQRPIDIDFAGSDGAHLLILTTKMILCYCTESGGLELSHAIREAARVVCFCTTSTFITGGVHHLAMWTIAGAEGGNKQVHKLPFKLGAHAARSIFVDIITCRSRCPSSPILILALASDGRVLEFQHGKSAPDRIIQTRVFQATAISMLGNSILIITGGGGMVKIMDTEKWTTIGLLPMPPSFPTPTARNGHASPRHRNDMSISATAAVPDGVDSLVVQYGNSSICCWDLQDALKPSVKWEHVGHADAIVSLCAPPVPCTEELAEQVYATVCVDGYVRIWHFSSCNGGAAQVKLSVRLQLAIPKPTLSQTRSHDDSGFAVAALSAAGEMLAVGEFNGSVSVYILPSPTRYRLDITHDSKVVCLTWGSAYDGQCLASGGDDGRVHLHRIHGARICPLQTIEATSAVTCLAMQDANTDRILTLAVGEQNRTVTLWRQTCDEFQVIHKIRLQEIVGCLAPVVNCVQALASHEYIALLLTNAHVLLVDSACGQILRTLKLEHSIAPTCLSSSGSVVACGHQDGSVSVVDALSGDNLALLKSHSESVSGCWLDAHRLELMTTSHDGFTHIWDVSPMVQRLQQSAASRNFEKLKPTVTSLSSGSKPECLPLQDLQNIIAGRNQDLAPVPSHLFSPTRALETSRNTQTDALLASQPMPTDRHIQWDVKSSLSRAAASSAENEESTTFPVRHLMASQDLASASCLRGSTMSAFRHSIAGGPSAELRRKALQRQRDHKLWESSYMSLWEELRTELEARPVRRNSKLRKSMTHIEMKSTAPDHVHLNMSTVLSPIPQSVAESISTTRTSRRQHTASLSFRRSFSAPLDSPQHDRQSGECLTCIVSPTACIAPTVDESFGSLTLPSPTIVAKDMLQVGGFMQLSEPVVTPAVTPPVTMSPSHDGAMRSDVKRGFEWQTNGAFKDAECINTGSSVRADQLDQHWDHSEQSINGMSPSPGVEREGCPAPAFSLGRAVHKCGAAVTDSQLCSTSALYPGSTTCQSSRQSGFKAEDPKSISNDQRLSPVLTRVGGGSNPPLAVFRHQSTSESSNCGQQITPGCCYPKGLEVEQESVRSPSLCTSSANQAADMSASLEAPKHGATPVKGQSGCRHIPRHPNHSRASRASGDTLDTPLSSLASLSSQHARELLNCVNSHMPLQTSPTKHAATQMSGSIPPRVSKSCDMPDFGQTTAAECKLDNVSAHVPGFGAKGQWQHLLDMQEVHPMTAFAAPRKTNVHHMTSTLAATQAVDQRSGGNHGEAAGVRSDTGVCAKPASTHANNVVVSAAMDAAFSSALKEGVQRVISTAVTKGWNLQSQDFRVSLAAEFTKESERLAAISAELRQGVVPSAGSSAESQDRFSVMWDQLSILKNRMPACQPNL